ncbi:MAG: lytic transglycosylase domain-containing protein [Vicinamibacterales bacterium]
MAGEARADIVVFKTGRTMSVQAIRVEGDRATLVLRAGGEASFSAALIERVDPDEVPYPVPVVAEAVAAVERPAELPFTGPSDEVLAKRPFAGLISSVAQSQGVPARLVHALIEVESNYQPRARSPKGARGLMQLMPATARQYGVKNSYDPKANLEAGVRHLKDLLSRLELPTALAAYNAGEGTVSRYGGLPPFPETQSYVRRILQKIGR